MNKYPEINEFVGCTFASIERGDDSLTFRKADGTGFQMTHFQDCCESVVLEEVVGDLDDLIGAPILEAEEATNMDEGEKPRGYVESWTWTFYKLRTVKGGVTLRWLGESNGYYSERVDIIRV